MRLTSLGASLLLLLFAFTGLASADVKTGASAPDFKLQSADGKTHRLSDFKGKYVVLEWVNFGCPFVRKHYDSKNMQNLQKKWTDKDVVWLSVCSSAPGKQGYYDQKGALKQAKSEGSKATAYLLDSDGKVGRAYGAKATPHMFVIDPEQTVIYQGAIDSIRSFKQSDIPKADNYVDDALQAAMAGKEVANGTTNAYGCSVKY